MLCIEGVNNVVVVFVVVIILIIGIVKCDLFDSLIWIIFFVLDVDGLVNVGVMVIVFDVIDRICFESWECIV